MSRRTKILMVIDNFDHGGAQALLLDLVRGLNPEKFAPMICSLRPPKAFAKQLADLKVPVVYFSDNKGLLFKFLELVVLIRKHDIDVVHTHLTGARMLGVLAAKLGRVKKIFSHDHSGDEFLRKHPWLTRLILFPAERLLTIFTDRIFAVSEAIALYNRKTKKLPEKKIEVIYNWIDAERFAFSADARTELRKRWAIPAESLVIGSVGRLAEQKGHRYLVDAANVVLDLFPHAVFVIVGDGPERVSLEKYALALGIDHSFRFPGFSDNIEKVYSAFDLFVLPSIYEPFGIVLLEAMACGVPIVASDVGGVVEIVEDRQTGILVPPGDPAALARGIVGVMEHRETVAKPMIAKAKKMLQSKFDRKLTIARIESLYRGVAL